MKLLKDISKIVSFLLCTAIVTLLCFLWYDEAKALDLRPYKENYISYSEFKESKEIKFQISFMEDIYDLYGLKLSMAYTQRSYWDVFNEGDSRPFRETNYNPQAYFNYRVKPCLYKIGYWHESNGQKNNYDQYGNRSIDSRSWDRSYIEVECKNHKFFSRFSYWDVLLSEHPEIEEKAGNAQLYVRYEWRGFQFSTDVSKAHREIGVKLPHLMSRNVIISYSIRQGYLDSLIDWDEDILRHSLKISFGGE